MTHYYSHDSYCGTPVSITDVCCRPSSLQCGGEEQTTAPKVVFPRAGVFVKHLGRQRIVADPNHVLFFNPGEPYRVSHPVPGGDDCTSFAFTADVLIDVLSLYEPAVHDHEKTPFSLTHCRIELKTLLRQQQLRRLVSASAINYLEVEEAALELLHLVIRDAYLARGVSPGRQRPATRRARGRIHTEAK